MEEIGYLIKNIADKLKLITEKELQKYDLTLSQSRVLIYLNSCGGEAIQKEIQEFFRVTHPTIIGIIARLEKKGFVRTWLNVKNKKEKIVELTERAVFVVEDMERAKQEREQLLKSDMTDEEVEKFLCVLQRMEKIVNEVGAEKREKKEKKVTKKNNKTNTEEEAILWFL